MRLWERQSWSRITPAFSAVAFLVAGCSDGNATDTSSSSNANSCGPTADVASVGPLIAISTSVYSPDLSTRTDTIQFADNLTASGKVDPARAIELKTTNTTLWSSVNKGEMFVADSATGTVIKYGLATNGKIEERGKCGFGAHGVTSFYWPQIVHATSTKSFLFDEKTLQGFIWNPDCMTITSAVDLKDEFNTTEGGKTYTVWRERQVLEVGGKYYSSFQYIEPLASDVLSRSGMLVFDPADDSFSIIEIPDCPGLTNSVLGPEGMIYSASSLVTAAAQYLGAPVSTCLARFDPTKMAWDESYKPDIAAVAAAAGGKVVGALYKNKANEKGPVYMRMLLDSMVPASINSPLILVAAPLWQTFALDDLVNPTKLTNTGVAPSGGLIYPIEMDGKTYVSDAALLEGKSWMVDLSVDPPARALAMVGWGFWAVKVH